MKCGIPNEGYVPCRFCSRHDAKVGLKKQAEKILALSRAVAQVPDVDRGGLFIKFEKSFSTFLWVKTRICQVPL
jgi:hypothetical protein